MANDNTKPAPDAVAVDQGCIADPPASCPRNCYSEPNDPDTLCDYAIKCRRFRQLVCRQSAQHAAMVEALKAADKFAERIEDVSVCSKGLTVITEGPRRDMDKALAAYRAARAKAGL